jgi:hypothetical protein
LQTATKIGEPSAAASKVGNQAHSPEPRRVLWDPLSPWPKARPWLWALLALIGIWTQGPLIFASLNPPHNLVQDFFEEWASARNLFNGIPVYTRLHVSLERYIHPSAERPIMDVNGHPPPAVLLAIPLVGLDYFNAHLVWNLISLAALGVSLGLIARELAIPLPRWSVFPILTLLLYCVPLRDQLYQGQSNLVMLALITGAWSADRHSRPMLAGALLGTAIAIKLFPGFLLLYFLGRRRWRACAGTVAGVAIWNLLALCVLGIGTYRDYYLEIAPGLKIFLSWWGNYSLNGLSRKLFGPATEEPWLYWRIVPVWNRPELAKALWLGLGLLVAAVVCRAALRARTLRQTDQAFSLALAGMLLVSPITWGHYFLLLVLPLILVWLDLPPNSGARAAFGLVVGVLWFPFGILIRYMNLIPPLGTASHIQALTLLSTPCYALIGLFLLVLVETKGQRGSRLCAAVAHDHGRPSAT